MLGFALTGYLLPWDQKGYWATQVATGIMGSVPGGEPLRVLLQGGTEYGNLTLTRFYTLHVFVLPIGLAALLGIHLTLFRKHGVTPPVVPQAELERKMQRFFPSQLLWDVVGDGGRRRSSSCSSRSRRTARELFAPAQPASNFVARPEWYFLTLFQLLKYFEGPLQIVATVIIPGAVTTFLVLLPWLDRARSRKAGERMPVLAAVALLMSGVVTLTGRSRWPRTRRTTNSRRGSPRRTPRRSTLASSRRPACCRQGGDAVFLNDPQVATKNLFKEHCATCHTHRRRGRRRGAESDRTTRTASGSPRSSATRSDKRFFGGTKTHHEMEPYPADKLPDDKLAAVVEYLTSLIGRRGRCPSTPRSPTRARSSSRTSSTAIRVTRSSRARPRDGPNFAGQRVDAPGSPRVMHDSSADDLFGKSAGMPKFGKKLSDEEMRQLTEFVVSQRESKTAGNDAAHRAGRPGVASLE